MITLTKETGGWLAVICQTVFENLKKNQQIIKSI